MPTSLPHQGVVEFPEEGRAYRGVRGGFYRIVLVGTLTDGNDTVVIGYRDLDGGKIWVSTLQDFLELVPWDDGEVRPRFVPVASLPRRTG